MTPRLSTRTARLALAIASVALLSSCAGSADRTSAPAEAAAGADRGGDGLWDQLERSRLEKERRLAEGETRSATVEEKLARGRAQVPPEVRRRYEAWWDEFLRGDVAWLQSRHAWRAEGKEARETLAENLIIVMVRAFESKNGPLYERARAELFEMPLDAAPYLVAALSQNHGDDVVRSHVVALLGDIGPPALTAVVGAYDRASPRGKLDLARAVSAMGEKGAPGTTPFLTEVAEEDDDIRLRLTAIEGLGRGRDPNAVPVLLQALRDDDVSVRKFAAASLAVFPEPRVVDALIEALARSEGGARADNREGEVALNVVRSLRTITRRSFGTAREWKQWRQTRAN